MLFLSPCDSDLISPNGSRTLGRGGSVCFHTEIVSNASAKGKILCWRKYFECSSDLHKSKSLVETNGKSVLRFFWPSDLQPLNGFLAQ